MKARLTLTLGIIMFGLTGTLAVEGASSVKLTVVYDNIAANGALTTDWGFACLVETPGHTVLFDTGASGDVLMSNLAALGRDPRRIEAVVLSHEHGDHVGGLAALLAAANRPRVYMPASFPAQLKDTARAAGTLVELSSWTHVVPGVLATGPVTGQITEQALIVATTQGIVVVTGCAHPGIAAMVRRGLAAAKAARLPGGPVALVIGGFHLGGTAAVAIDGIVQDLRALEVQRVAPSHCTGDAAIRQFAVAFGDRFLASGAGWTLEMQTDAPDLPGE